MRLEKKVPEKITGKTEDRAKLNFEQLLEFVTEKFPSCVIEKQVEEKNEATGATEIRYERAINWQALGTLVGTGLSEEQGIVRRELFGFAWSGKNEAAREANRVIDMTLRPCPAESLDWNNTGNLYIEGDNLQALKMLQGSYLGKVKMIYIDPPYNTGNEFVYNDDFRQNQEDYAQESGEIDEVSGARLVSKAFTLNANTSPRYHSKWCSMMYSRLLLARDLLRRDGVIFISIDDHEQHHLRDICDEIFGERNFVAQFVWQRAYSPKNDADYVPYSHDYVLMYVRELDSFAVGRLPFTEEARDRYKNPDNDPRGPWKSGDFSVQRYDKDAVYPITTPSGRVVYPARGRCWNASKEKFEALVKDNRIYFGEDGNCKPSLKYFLNERKSEDMTPTSLSLLTREFVEDSELYISELKTMMDAGIFSGLRVCWLLNQLLVLAVLSKGARKALSDFVKKLDVADKLPTSLMLYEWVGHSQEGAQELKAIMNDGVFDGPKPVRLIRHLLTLANLAPQDGDIVLDFFSGSATTAEAVMRANAEDGGNRRFILVQLPEECKANKPAALAGYRNICEIGKERIRRVANAIASQVDCTKIVHGGGYECFR